MKAFKIYSLYNSIVGFFILLMLYMSNTYATTYTTICTMAEERLCNIYAPPQQGGATSTSSGSAVAPQIEFYINTSNIDNITPSQVYSTFGGSTTEITVTDGFIDSAKGMNNQFFNYAVSQENLRYFNTAWIIRDVEEGEVSSLPPKDAKLKEKFANSPKHFKLIDGYVPHPRPHNSTSPNTLWVRGIFWCTRLLAPGELKAREDRQAQCLKNAGGDVPKEKSCSLM